MEDIKIRFKLNTPNNQVAFHHWNQIDNPLIAEKAAEAFMEWEKKLRKHAAEFLLRELLGAERAKCFRINYEQQKESQPDKG